MIEIVKSRFFQISLLLIILVATAAFFFSTESTSQNYRDYYEDAFLMLQEQRDSKKQRVIDLLDGQYEAVKVAASENGLLPHFRNLLTYTYNQEFRSTKYKETVSRIEEYFAINLLLFYDVLFLSVDNDIFFTIKREADMGLNISNPAFDKTELKNRIDSLESDTILVDFEQYSFSKEPAAFFIAPVFIGIRKLGSLVFQLPINKINSIMASYSGLPDTGEVYLLNKNGQFLSESRFVAENTILNRKVDSLAFSEASTTKSGEKILRDYRGKRVLSSFQAFSYRDNTWTIIAEMDERELLTDIYLKNEGSTYSFLSSNIIDLDYKKSAVTTRSYIPSTSSNATRVDLNESMSTFSSGVLYTQGVATCASVAINLPDKFSYLTHITPTDWSYNSDEVLIALGEMSTNLLEDVLFRIKRFDVLGYEISDLKVSFAATHTKNLRKSISKFLDHKITLDQIKVLVRRDYESIDVTSRNDSVLTYWHKPDSSEINKIAFSEVPSLATLLRNSFDLSKYE